MGGTFDNSHSKGHGPVKLSQQDPGTCGRPYVLHEVLPWAGRTVSENAPLACNHNANLCRVLAIYLHTGESEAPELHHETC